MTLPLEPQILAQTERWIVVNKPGGWLTIPGREKARAGGSRSEPVLLDWVGAQLGARVWTVHRIDRETSGVVLFARSENAHREANGWFEHRKVRKRYECLAQGAPAMPLFKINRPVEGKQSVSQVEVRERFGGIVFLASVVPTTGRRHQIRIHLSEAGFPLLGDVQYEGTRKLSLNSNDILEVRRVALHAAELALPTGEVFSAPLPADFEQWINRLREVSHGGG